MGQPDLLETFEKLKAVSYETSVSVKDLKYAGGLKENIQTIYDSLRRLKKGKFIMNARGRWWKCGQD